MFRITSICLGLVLLASCSEQATKPPAADATVITPASFNKAGAPTVEFSVPDMMCPDGCGAKVKEILAEQPGAKDVLVDFPAKTATVAIDKEKFDSKQAVAALVDHQFKNSALKDASDTSAAATSPAAGAKSVQ
jgi:copper chaperone CopZ